MRRLATVLGLGALLCSTSAIAGTPGALCRRACKPRVLEQCAGLVGRELRRCRKPLVRSCKATTPAIACPTTADLERDLGDRLLRTDDPRSTQLTLCASGDFTATERVPAGGNVAVIQRHTGTWRVDVGSGGLALALDDGTPARALARDATGALLVDGLASTLSDATAACDPQPAAPSAEDADRATIVALTRTLADRTLVIDAPDGSVGEQRELRLCSSGRATDTTRTDAGQVLNVTVATWTVDASSGGRLLLDHPSGTQAVFGLEQRADGTLLVDDAVVEVRDARAACADDDLRDRLTSALGGTAWFFVRQVGAIPVRFRLGLCDSGRYRLTTTSVETGAWSVAVVNGVATLVLDPDAGATRLANVTATLADDGGPRLDGIAPSGDDAVVTAACGS